MLKIFNLEIRKARPRLPAIPRPTPFTHESRKEYRKRLLEWMIDREELR